MLPSRLNAHVPCPQATKSLLGPRLASRRTHSRRLPLCRTFTVVEGGVYPNVMDAFTTEDEPRTEQQDHISYVRKTHAEDEQVQERSQTKHAVEAVHVKQLVGDLHGLLTTYVPRKRLTTCHGAASDGRKKVVTFSSNVSVVLI